MKLAELLARELKVWPEGSVCSTQEGNYSAYFWKSSDVHFDKGGWDHASGYGLITQGWWHGMSELATDHATAIVTRADWEAEVARLAVVKPEWIRHRGGKCPVEAGVLVDVRYRDGDVSMRQPALLRGDPSDAWAEDWSHSNNPSDIMAYRICEPVKSFDPERALKDAECAGAIITVETDIEFPSGVIHFAGPIAWRDRIREIDITVEALEEERAGLVQQLEDEGFRLIGKAAEPVVDMSDWRNWRVGDEIEYISSEYGNIYTKGNKYKVKSVEASCAYVFDNIGGLSACSIDDLDINLFRWHSRPSA